jgi:hypothetical protein
LSQTGLYSVVVTNFGTPATSAPVALRIKRVALFAGNQLLTNGTYTFVTPPTLSILTAFTNGSAFYTLDGSTPTFASQPYSSPFTVSNTATVRAVGYSAEFNQSEEADSVQVVVFTNHTLSATTAGGGAVTLNPPGGSYYSNQIVTATASPSPGWTFLYWQGDAGGTAPAVNISVDRDMAIQAVFGTTLSTTVNGNGQVQVFPPSGPYAFGSTVRLTAIPAAGYYLGVWGNAASGNLSPLYFTVTNANPTVSSLFAPVPAGQANLTILISGPGKVTANPQTNLFSTSQSVTLTATPNAGQSFLSWSGDASGTVNPLVVAMTQSKTIRANFSSPVALLRTDRAGDGWSTRGFHLTLAGDAQAAWQIQGSSNLVSWQPLGIITNAQGEIPFLDADAAALPWRFYRAFLVP